MVDESAAIRGTNMKSQTSVPLLNIDILKSSAETFTLQSSFASDSFQTYSQVLQSSNDR